MRIYIMKFAQRLCDSGGFCNVSMMCSLRVYYSWLLVDGGLLRVLHLLSSL
jgi:hypothetical protein